MSKASLELELTGRTEKHLVSLDQRISIHAKCLSDWKQLCAAAEQAGFTPQIISGFRSFSAQVSIWNAKLTGQRPVLDSSSHPIAIGGLQPLERIHAVLRWSALPGASRHHWGTDFDVIDAKRLEPGMKVALIDAEFAEEGPFGALHRWLDRNLGSFGFFRPYASDRGGVAPERWHLSYAPVAQDYYYAHSEEVIRAALEAADIELKEIVIDNLPEIFDRYVRNIEIP